MPPERARRFRLPPKRRAAVPLGDAPSFAPAARRTRAVRLALAVLLAGTLAAAAALAPDEEAPPSFVPPEASGVIALDVSASISRETYGRIESALRGLARSDGRYGLVVFSDTAYVALPPGTPARELDRFADIFAIPATSTGGIERRPPPNPWTRTFVGGTRISAGLRLAGQALAAARIRDGAVILVSDLDDDPTDSARLVAAVQSLERGGVPLRVIGLRPSSGDARYFEALLGRSDAVQEAPPAGDNPTPEVGSPSEPAGALPVALVVLASVFAIALALNEHLGAELLWRARPGRRP